MIAPDGETAYVVISGHPGAVTPITTATNRPGKPITVGDWPEAIAITPDGKTVYVASINSNTVTPISAATFEHHTSLHGLPRPHVHNIVLTSLTTGAS